MRIKKFQKYLLISIFLIINIFMGIITPSMAKNKIRKSDLNKKKSCTSTHLYCDDSTFKNLLPSFIMARILEQKKDLKITVSEDLKIRKTQGRASCYANKTFCQGASADGYAYKKTASGVCANPDKYTAAVDVHKGDPIYHSSKLGSLIFANNNGKTAIFVTTDRGNMNQHGVKFDLAEEVQNDIQNSRNQNVEFYGLKQPSSRLSKEEIERYVDCATEFNHTFDKDKNTMQQLTEEQKNQIESGTSQKLVKLGIGAPLNNENINNFQASGVMYSSAKKYNPRVPSSYLPAVYFGGQN